ncbi:helix-turn-helix domain-containing protein [Rubritalea tangerina]|uniref:Helix-turn-helix domain-containing protein n=1 Tax=Rubritalea tangerina TaxID=430798 RepID=A0ABW4Z834_9BACT
MENTTYLIDYDVHVPNPRDPEKVEVRTIKVPARLLFEDGPEVLAEGATELIEATKARFMGLMQPGEIKALRTSLLQVKQSRFSELLGLGAKTPSTWENGRERPSRSLNLLLRLIEHYKPSEDILEELHCGFIKPAEENVIPFITADSENRWVGDDVACNELEYSL